MMQCFFRHVLSVLLSNTKSSSSSSLTGFSASSAVVKGSRVNTQHQNAHNLWGRGEMLHMWKWVFPSRIVIFRLIRVVMLNDTVIRHCNNTWLAQYVIVIKVNKKLIRLIAGHLGKCVNKPMSSNTSQRLSQNSFWQTILHPARHPLAVFSGYDLSSKYSQPHSCCCFITKRLQPTCKRFLLGWSKTWYLFDPFYENWL